jgi:hypothetical protein
VIKQPNDDWLLHLQVDADHWRLHFGMMLTIVFMYGLPMHHVSNIVDLHSGNRDNNDDERSDRNAGEKRKRSDDKVFGAVSSSVYSYH